MDAKYYTLSISIHRVSESYQVEVSHRDPDSQAQVAPLRGTAAFDPAALLQHEEVPANYGKTLAAQLFSSPDVAQRFIQVETAAQASSRYLRILVCIDPSAQELQGLRWELLRHPESGVALSTSERMLVSRFMVSRDWRPVKLRARSELSALIAVSAPEPSTLQGRSCSVGGDHPPDRAACPAWASSWRAGAHLILAELGASVYVTTNFDPLLEWALEANAKTPQQVRTLWRYKRKPLSPDEIQIDRPSAKAPLVYHVFGGRSRRRTTRGSAPPRGSRRSPPRSPQDRSSVPRGRSSVPPRRPPVPPKIAPVPGGDLARTPSAASRTPKIAPVPRGGVVRTPSCGLPYPSGRSEPGTWVTDLTAWSPESGSTGLRISPMGNGSGSMGATIRQHG